MAKSGSKAVARAKKLEELVNDLTNKLDNLEDALVDIIQQHSFEKKFSTPHEVVVEIKNALGINSGNWR
jgi:hypothetical protein